jgi:hypothetical protein
MRRKNERKAITAAIVFFISTIVNADITYVNIVPIIPTNVDQISIITYGIEGSGGVDITSTDFIQNGFLLELNIYLDLG